MSQNQITHEGASNTERPQNKFREIIDKQKQGRNQSELGYHKEAISTFRKIDYLQGLNGHSEFKSANTLQNSVRNPINFDGQFDRFKTDKNGGYFSNTYWNETTLRHNKFHKANEPKKEDLPNGRPLFARELSMNNPPPTTYDIKRNIDIKAINPKDPCTFGASFQSYRKTMDIAQEIKVYDFNALKTDKGFKKPNVEQTKKRFPAYSQSKGAQFTLWAEQEKQGLVTPAPCQYNQDDKHIKMNRFAGISLGKDVKCNKKLIKFTPGPADYEIQPALNNSVIKNSFNYKLNNGGIIPGKSSGESKDLIMAKSLIGGKIISGFNSTTPRGGVGVGVNNGSSTIQNSIFSTQQQLIPQVDIIQQNKLAVNSANFQVMNTTQNSGQYDKINLKDIGNSKYEEHSNSMTNVSKTKDTQNGESIQFPASVRNNYNQKLGKKGKKNRKGKKQFLPSLYDEFNSPRDGMLQYNSEFRRRPKFGEIDRDDGGYDTEVKTDRNLKYQNIVDEAFNTGSVDGVQEHGWQSSTQEARFGGSLFTVTRNLKQKKANLKNNMLLTEQKKRHNHAKSLTANSTRMDHTCFI